MASPIGHTLVGIGIAAAVAQVTDTRASPTLWLGAVIASNLPDLDWMAILIGRSFYRFHRQATHSLLMLGLLILAVWSLSLLQGGIESGLGLAWAMALLSHSLLDLVTTGPEVAGRGFGVPLLWPVYSRRWYLQQPIFQAAEFKAYRSVKGAWKAILPEIYHLGPICVLLVLLGYLL